MKSFAGLQRAIDQYRIEIAADTLKNGQRLQRFADQIGCGPTGDSRCRRIDKTDAHFGVDTDNALFYRIENLLVFRFEFAVAARELLFETMNFDVCADARDDFIGLKRLRNVIDTANSESTHLGLTIAERRQKNHGD